MAVTPSTTTCRPSLDEVRALAAEHDLVPVVTELLADCDTPVSAFLRLGVAPGSFLLESVEGGERLARYSFLGRDPMATITLQDGVAVVRDAAGAETREEYSDPLVPVERLVSEHRVAPVPGAAPPLIGGAIGFLSYEAATRFERVPVAPRDPLGIPEGWFALVDTLIAFDHVTHRMLLLTHARTPRGADVERAYADAVARLEDLRDRLRQPLPPPVTLPDESVAAAHADETANFSRPDYLRAVERCKEYILAGDVFQAQVGRRFAVPLRAAPFDVYRALRSINPSPYMFFLATPVCDIVGASPEMLVRVTGSHVEYHPIAGTRRRGSTPERDAALERELLESEKERAEHLMLVDLGRNDVGRVCRTGTVKVTEFMEIERYSHVMHMVSSITGELRPDCTAVDALRACFPAGTVTGAPKVRAMEIIAELEPEVRGVYAGTVGYLGFGGNLDTAITLRTLLVKDGVAYAQASGGIVADSTPQEEALEIDNKVAAVLAAVATANRGLEA
ncbi:MAG TPA: anthranilate synthase component I [Candidatus Dormibacteraeota bacterium]|jgi:anthranilate synthase component 1|nr:anthranilate synthase component I [Candidatus Dormibacteraeota bacterium]